MARRLGALIELGTDDVRGEFGVFNDFENSVFGADFSCSLEEVEHWVESEAFVYRALVNKSGGVFEPTGVASLLIASEASGRALLEGSIRENQIEPATIGSLSTPVFVYFSSLVASHRAHRELLMNSLISETVHRVGPSPLGPGGLGVIGIVCTHAGGRYVEREGFRESGVAYLGRHPIVRLEERSMPVDSVWRPIVARPPG